MNQIKTNLKQRYALSRHHAWAGTVLLSMLLALRLLIEIPSTILFLSIIILAGYILIALFYTYKYRQGLLTNSLIPTKSYDLEKEKITAELHKQQLKLEKKKAKTTVKTLKKASEDKGEKPLNNN